MFVQTMKANDTTVTIHCMHSKPWSQVENLQTQTTMFVHTMQTNVIMLMGVDYTEIMMWMKSLSMENGGRQDPLVLGL